MCLQHGPVQELCFCDLSREDQNTVLSACSSPCVEDALRACVAMGRGHRQILIGPAYKKRACKESQCAEAMPGS